MSMIFTEVWLQTLSNGVPFYLTSSMRCSLLNFVKMQLFWWQKKRQPCCTQKAAHPIKLFHCLEMFGFGKKLGLWCSKPPTYDGKVQIMRQLHHLILLAVCSQVFTIISHLNVKCFVVSTFIAKCPISSCSHRVHPCRNRCTPSCA